MSEIVDGQRILWLWYTNVFEPADCGSEAGRSRTRARGNRSSDAIEWRTLPTRMPPPDSVLLPFLWFWAFISCFGFDSLIFLRFRPFILWFEFGLKFVLLFSLYALTLRVFVHWFCLCDLPALTLTVSLNLTMCFRLTLCFESRCF